LTPHYATTAQDAVRASRGEFNFVLDCNDLKVERERVERVLQPLDYPKGEVEEAIVAAGNGSLSIRDYKITPGKRTAHGVDLGEIHWIRF